MDRVVIVFGPPATGKTTLSSMFARKHKNWAFIDADTLNNMTAAQFTAPLDDDGTYGALLLKNICSLATNFREAGFDLIINYVFKPNQLLDLADSFRDCKVDFFFVTAPVEVALSRASNRIDPEEEDDIRKYHEYYATTSFESVPHKKLASYEARLEDLLVEIESVLGV
ncbi:MAG: AAA family ATPase [Pseudobacteriovorax sp.]|nr:AAA family ATPase [Pseudobacteriovorax sp.]